ncbi:hypothetical protein C8Q79DRAFT_910189 [Trametes meyenii]|nr:hypothetical protein C8Q79DRAFT_910189 [Trametes meyenii]
MPYLVGALAGVGAVGLVGYAWYHFSGTKRVVDTVMAIHQRYNEVKDTAMTASKKRALAREKAAVATAAAKEHAVSATTKERTTGLVDRWKQRYRAASSKKGGDSEVCGPAVTMITCWSFDLSLAGSRRKESGHLRRGCGFLSRLGRFARLAPPMVLVCLLLVMLCRNSPPLLWCTPPVNSLM